MKIALIGLPYDNNLGDLIMMEAIEKIIQDKAQEKIEFVWIDLLTRDNQTTKSFFNRILSKVTGFTEKFVSEKLSQKINYQRFHLFEEKKVQDHLKALGATCDVAIFVGGGLINFRTNRFVNHFTALIETLAALNVPIILNALGVEQGYDVTFFNCRRYKQALNQPQILAISTRDHLETLRKYVDDATKTSLVADSACGAYELFQVETVKRKVIGIGVIRPGIFDSYKTSQWKKKYIRLLENLLDLLLQNHIAFELFTNGNTEDQAFAKELLAQFDLDESYLAKRPTTSMALISLVASYQKVVCSRLHAAIIAYSADVPFIGIDWNGKLKSFGQQIQAPDCIYYPDEITAPELMAELKNLQQVKWTAEENKKYLASEYSFLFTSLEKALQLKENVSK